VNNSHPTAIIWARLCRQSKVLDAAQETGAKAALISTIISHNAIHRINVRRFHDLAVEQGIRDGIILIAGGTQVNDAMAVECGMDAGFGRGTKGRHVSSFIVGKMMGKSAGKSYRIVNTGR